MDSNPVNQDLANLDTEIFVGYASSTMHSDLGLWVEVGLLIFTFVVVVPSIAAAIGYAAWKGKPKNFDREMYWTAFGGLAPDASRR